MGQVQTPEFRVSWPNVFTPKVNKLSQDQTLEYNVVMLFGDGADMTDLKASIKEACVKKWGADPNTWPKPLRTPLRNQGEKAKHVDGKMVLPNGYKDGNIFISAKSKQAPGVVDQALKPITEADQHRFYSGCYARAVLNSYAYDFAGNRGVAFGLIHLQLLRDGDPLSNFSKPEDVFKAVEMPASDMASASGSSAADIFS